MQPRDALSARLVEELGLAAHEGAHAAFAVFFELLAQPDAAPWERVALASILRRDLLAHMRFEEDAVVPLYAGRRVGPPPNGAPGAFLEDHGWIRRRADELVDRLLAATVRPIDPVLLRVAVALLDDLLEHHDLREREHLYPFLDATLEEPQRRRLLQDFARVTLIGADTAAQLLARWRAAGLGELERPYGSWARAEVPAAAPLPGALAALLGPERIRRLERLRERDRALAQRFLAAPPASPRQRAREERVVEEAFKSTLRFALDAAFEASFAAGARPQT